MNATFVENECNFLTFLLQKAYPNHNTLFGKFNHNFGIRGIPIQIFSSYLCNRKQFVKLENAQSGYVAISNGVLQRSVLGPLLFIMYFKWFTKLSAFYAVQYADVSIS